jgi:hypothetical protein
MTQKAQSVVSKNSTQNNSKMKCLDYNRGVAWTTGGTTVTL